MLNPLPTSPSRTSTRPLWTPAWRTQGLVGLTSVLLLCVMVLGGCQLKKKIRRFGSSCGQSSECETGLCYNGVCTSPCSKGADCSSGVCIEEVCQAADDDYDQDGLPNHWEIKHSLYADKVDSDDDGILDGAEVGPDLDHPLDSNGDGILDALQSNVDDADKDCVVNAFDNVSGPDPLPPAASLCGGGVCAGKTDQIQVVCDASLASAPVVAGCKGCKCVANGIADFQSPEVWCDGLDNDCNGKTDEGAVIADQGLGAACLPSHGICALSSTLGKVECGKDKKTICSTDGGSDSAGIAQLEVCNLLDDDCDGVTDNGYSFLGLGVGQSCQQCGFESSKCPDGQPLNPPLVTCTANGKAAQCGALPYDAGFETVTTGAPEPRPEWALGWREDLHTVSLFSGRVVSLVGSSPRDEEWHVQVDGSEGSGLWHQSLWQNPGKRTGAALAADPGAKLLWLAGGTDPDGVFGAQTFHSTAPDEWTEAPACCAPDAMAPLPAPVLTPSVSAPTRAAVLDNGGARVLVVIDRRYALPKWHTIGVPGAWADVEGEVAATTSAVRCAAEAPDHTGLLLAHEDGGWSWLSHAGTSVAASSVDMSGAPAVRPGAQCAIDGAWKLHVFGGYQGAKTTPEHWQASLTPSPTLPGGPQVAVQSVPVVGTAPEEQALQRAGGSAFWSPSMQAIVVAGGESHDGTNRISRPDVQVWRPALQVVARADKPLPRARFGHAGGWWPGQQAFCIAGGLTLELPASSGSPRVVPVEDAWCVDNSGNWAQKVATGIRYAFGAAAVDVKGGRLILTGGLALQGNDNNFTAAIKLWQGQLIVGTKVNPALAPTGAVQVVHLGGSLQEPGSLELPPSTGAPVLAAPAFAPDALRNRLLLVNGYDPAGEVQAFWSLDLESLEWTDLFAKLPNNLEGKKFAPIKRYGALAVYDSLRDRLAIIGGSLRANDGLLGYDVQQPPEGAGKVSSCLATGYVPLFVTKTLTQQAFVAQPLPLFASVESPTQEGTLLSPWLGGPVFTPVFFDAYGSHAWFAVAEAPPPLSPTGVATCGELGTSTLNVWDISHQLSLDLGSCGGAPAAKMGAQSLDQLPSALFAAAFQYVDGARQSWVVGGIEPDGALSSQVSVLSQTCKAVP